MTHFTEGRVTEEDMMYWNMFMKKRSEMKNERQWDAGVVWYYSTNKVLNAYLVQQREGVWAGARWVVINV